MAVQIQQQGQKSLKSDWSRGIAFKSSSFDAKDATRRNYGFVLMTTTVQGLNAASVQFLTDPSRPCCVAGPVGAHVDAREGGQECQHPGYRHRGRGQHPPAIATDRHHPGECEGQEFGPPCLSRFCPTCSFLVFTAAVLSLDTHIYGCNYNGRLHLRFRTILARTKQ